MRVIAGADPIATGDLRATAMVFLTIDHDDEAIEDAVMTPPVLAAYRCVGSADLVLMLGAQQTHRLDAFIVEDLRAVKGVRRVETAYVVEVLKHKTYLARILG
jgi:DNA-binding Lrp family transcriptional regulator